MRKGRRLSDSSTVYVALCGAQLSLSLLIVGVLTIELVLSCICKAKCKAQTRRKAENWPRPIAKAKRHAIAGKR